MGTCGDADDEAWQTHDSPSREPRGGTVQAADERNEAALQAVPPRVAANCGDLCCLALLRARHHANEQCGYGCSNNG
jgi:hypothetical protein